jgi:uncharacterized protein (TIGR02453 family)
MSVRFEPSLPAFLRELSRSNDREWFTANKKRFEREVQSPLLDFVGAMQPRLKNVSRHLVADARKSGGSLTRIYRDTRFSKDKRPYKTYMAMRFWHDIGKKESAPRFYIHVDGERAGIGAGCWHPDSEALGRIRTAISESARGWTRARDDAKQARRWDGLSGESLKRAPRGFDSEARHIEDIKRKDFILYSPLTLEEFTSPDFIDRVEARFRAAQPMMRFLAGALGLPY